jgi:hypothetical protein
MSGLTRREALLRGLAGTGAGAAAAALSLTGCGRDPTRPSGSTLDGTWVDLVGDGQLRRAPASG